MSGELTNLLSPDRVQSFRRSYFFRLGALGSVVLALLVIIHGIFLLPTHIFLTKKIAANEFELTGLSRSILSAGETSFEARLAVLSKSVERIELLGANEPVIKTLTKTLDILHTGIVLTGLSFAAPTTKKGTTISLSGIAATRDTLRQYQIALSNAPFIASADLPVSTYAKDTKIPFTIVVTLTKL